MGKIWEQQFKRYKSIHVSNGMESSWQIQEPDMFCNAFNIYLSAGFET